MNLSELFIRVNADISGIQKNMTAVQRSLDKTADRAAALGQKLTLGISVPLAALGGLSLKAAADFDSLRRGLEAVAGSAGAAEQQLARLREIAKLPAVDLNQAAQASIAFQAIGRSAEFAERTIKGVANAVALSGGTSQEFAGVLRQMRQIASMGKLMGEELNVILENAPAMAKALQNAFGTTSAEAIRNLNLTTEEFFERLQQGMESLPQVSGGAANSFDNLRQSLAQAAAVIGGQLLPAVIPLIDGFTRMLEGMQALNPETVRLGIAFGVTAAALGPLLSALSAVTKAFIALRAASLPLLASLGVGGALVIGIAALAGIWTKRRLDEWSQASTAVDNFALSIQGLSREQMILATANILKRIAELEPLAEHFQFARDEIDRLNKRAGELATQFNALGPAIQTGLVNPLGAVVTAADEAADALARLDARVGFRPRDRSLGDPSVVSGVGGRLLGGLDLNRRALIPRVLGSSSAPSGSQLDLGQISAATAAASIMGGPFGKLAGSVSQVAGAFATGGPLLGGITAAGVAFNAVSGLFGLGKTALDRFVEAVQASTRALDAQFALLDIDSAARQFELTLKQAQGLFEGLPVIDEFLEGLTPENIGKRIDEILKGGPGQAPLDLGTTNERARAFIDFLLKLETLGDQATKTATELGKATSSMTNVPVVFANALRRFQSSTVGVDGRSPVSLGPGAVGRDRPTLNFNAPVTVVANDPESFARQMEAYGANLEMRAGYSRFATVTG